MDSLGGGSTGVAPGGLATANVDLVVGILLFVLAGFGIAFGGLTIGRIARPRMPHPEKSAPYECGEPAIGTSWVQFDLRFYVVALVFIVFDVEIVLFYPWAVVFKEAGLPALYDRLFFFGVVVVGFLYLWKFDYLDWVRASTGQRREEDFEPTKLSEVARRMS